MCVRLCTTVFLPNEKRHTDDDCVSKSLRIFDILLCASRSPLCGGV